MDLPGRIGFPSRYRQDRSMSGSLRGTWILPAVHGLVNVVAQSYVGDNECRPMARKPRFGVGGLDYGTVPRAQEGEMSWWSGFGEA